VQGRVSPSVLHSDFGTPRQQIIDSRVAAHEAGPVQSRAIFRVGLVYVHSVFLKKGQTEGLISLCSDMHHIYAHLILSANICPILYQQLQNFDISVIRSIMDRIASFVGQVRRVYPPLDPVFYLPFNGIYLVFLDVIRKRFLHFLRYSLLEDKNQAVKYLVVIFLGGSTEERCAFCVSHFRQILDHFLIYAL